VTHSADVASHAANDKIPVSVVIISKNEERAIERCVRSVRDYAEVFVVDSHSTDRTKELAEAAGATVVPFTWDGRYPKKKQWALEHLPLTHDWVLYLDGDEYVRHDFDGEVRRLVAAPDATAYDVPLDYVFLGRELKHGHKVFKRVLFNRHKCRWRELDDLSVENPFEMELHVQPEVDGTIGRTTTTISHDDLEPLAHWFDRHNRYSDWEAVLRLDPDNTAAVERTTRGKVWARVPAKPLIFFLYSYLLRSGFRDGYAGLQYALANSFYYWQIDLKTRQLARART
jgi:glycosyltransferase involved in cell wall biosynthesis